MSGEESCNNPDFFVYDPQGALDIEATLKAVPDELDLTNDFFREVPEWFEVTPSAEAKQFLENLEAVPSETLRGLDPEDLYRMDQAFRKMVACTELYEKDDLSSAQKTFLRSLNYYMALYAMDTMPVPDEEESCEEAGSPDA